MSKWNNDPTPDYGHEAMVETIRCQREERGEITEYAAPGAERKWKARDLLDIHWRLTGIETPSESYNRIMSCIIGHANPNTGACYPRQSLIEIETGYSRDTINRAIKWWTDQGFLKTERRGIGKALAYHPQWKLLELHYIAVAEVIKEGKEAHAASRGGTHAASRGGTAMPHQGATQNLKAGTSKNKSQHEMVHPPSAADTPVREEREKGFSGKGKVVPLRQPSNSVPAARQRVESYITSDPFVKTYPPSMEAFEAAVTAEIQEVGSGRKIIQSAANDTWRAKRPA
jgi:hypothetical protein